MTKFTKTSRYLDNNRIFQSVKSFLRFFCVFCVFINLPGSVTPRKPAEFPLLKPVDSVAFPADFPWHPYRYCRNPHSPG